MDVVQMRNTLFFKEVQQINLNSPLLLPIQMAVFDKSRKEDGDEEWEREIVKRKSFKEPKTRAWYANDEWARIIILLSRSYFDAYYVITFIGHILSRRSDRLFQGMICYKLFI